MRKVAILSLFQLFYCAAPLAVVMNRVWCRRDAGAVGPNPTKTSASATKCAVSVHVFYPSSSTVPPIYCTSLAVAAH
jgi:hypothetical protein